MLAPYELGIAIENAFLLAQHNFFFSSIQIRDQVKKVEIATTEILIHKDKENKNEQTTAETKLKNTYATVKSHTYIFHIKKMIVFWKQTRIKRTTDMLSQS